MNDRFDVAVIGRGLIGAAAFRHLAAEGRSVVLVGSGEPVGTAEDKPYSSHYDQGRITRIAAFGGPWGRWAQASIERYGAIAERSGIDFHDPVGLVVMGADLRDVAIAGRRDGAEIDVLSSEQLFATTGITPPVPGHEMPLGVSACGLDQPSPNDRRADRVCTPRWWRLAR